MTSLFIPGRGDVNFKALKVDKAVNNYYERLFFARNEANGDWCVFMKMPPGVDPVPVLGFGVDIPDPEFAVKRLWECDTRVHGDRLFDEMIKSQERYKNEKRYAASQASGDSAERIEHLLRQYGKSPVIKSTRKKGVSDDA